MRCLKYSIFLPLALLSATAAHPLQDAGSNPDEKAGAVLYRDKGCPQCHGADFKGNKKGPALDRYPNDPEWPPQRITKQITDGGPKMPPFGESLTDPEVAQLVTFLRAKRPARAAGEVKIAALPA